MTELRPAYLVMDAPILYTAEELAFLSRAIQSIEVLHNYFDPVLLDVTLDDVIALKAELNKTSNAGASGLLLSRGRRADLCSILSCLLSDYVSLYPKHIDLHEDVLFALERKAYGHEPE